VGADAAVDRSDEIRELFLDLIDEVVRRHGGGGAYQFRKGLAPLAGACAKRPRSALPGSATERGPCARRERRAAAPAPGASSPRRAWKGRTDRRRDPPARWAR